MKINRKKFFDTYRQNFGKLSQSLVDNLNFLLSKLEIGRFKLPSQMAYILATIKHETADTFRPVVEAYHIKPENKRINALYNYYKKNNIGALSTIFPNGLNQPTYEGRGYVQLTHNYNYEKFDIKDTPEKALEPDTAFMILEKGMANGTFTGLKLQTYVNENITDYKNARRVINGLDRAANIAVLAKTLSYCIDLVSDDLAMAGYNQEEYLS